jgi:predicted ATPase
MRRPLIAHCHLGLAKLYRRTGQGEEAQEHLITATLLQAIADLPDDALRRGLLQLQAAEFLYETALYPDPEYAFTHALTHEVTYDGLLQERRRTLHARIVDAIETLEPDRIGEQIERLAHHAFHGALPEKATHYLRQAGLRAAARSALQDARTWFEQALTVLQMLPDSSPALERAFDIRLELRPVLAQLGEIRLALAQLREAEGLPNGTGSPADRACPGRVSSGACVHVSPYDGRLLRVGARSAR